MQESEARQAMALDEAVMLFEDKGIYHPQSLWHDPNARCGLCEAQRVVLASVQKYQACIALLEEALRRLLNKRGHHPHCEILGGKCGWLRCAEARALLAHDDVEAQDG